LEEGELNKESEEKEQIPLRLEVLGAEVKDGFLWNGTKTLTTTDEAQGFVDTLEKMDINSLLMVLRGWQNGGQSGVKYGTMRAEGLIGGKRGISELEEKLNKSDSLLYLYANADRDR
jgi:hypothetical protein